MGRSENCSGTTCVHRHGSYGGVLSQCIVAHINITSEGVIGRREWFVFFSIVDI